VRKEIGLNDSNDCSYNLTVKEVMEKQTRADQLQGYDFVAYHSYAKRRYYEIVGGESIDLKL
jgi:hypothetical protein